MASRVKILCNWRVSKAEPSGLHVWFDPTTEVLKIYALEPSEIPRVGEGYEGVDPTDSPDGESSTSELESLELPF